MESSRVDTGAPRNRPNALPGNGKPSKPKSLDKITAADLHDDAVLDSWWRAEGQGLVGPHPEDRLIVFAVAERAIQLGTSKPAGMFSKLIRDRDKARTFPDLEQQDRAQKRIKDFDRRQTTTIEPAILASMSGAGTGGKNASA